MVTDPGYEPVIGLEIHAQLRTRTKLFCGCLADFGAAPNTRLCPVCMGLPGALPTLNRQAVALAVRAALGLGCRIGARSVFTRKHYFYPDLPKGYQITQGDFPLGTDGTVHLAAGMDSSVLERVIRVERLHLEEDTGKSVHHAEYGLVDLNRAGIPLIEIVTLPDLRSSQEASDCLGEIRNVLMRLEVCDGNMEEGSLRCDVNISVRKSSGELGSRVEVKNLNSFRFIRRAIGYEQARQAEILRSGGQVQPETRGWNEREGKTYTLRSKVSSNDYRMVDEPDLLPLDLSRDWVRKQQAQLPELPYQTRKRYASLGLSRDMVITLHSQKWLMDLFDEVMELGLEPSGVANFLATEVLRDAGQGAPIRAWQVGELMGLVAEGTISGKQMKELYGWVKSTDESPRQVAAERGLRCVADESTVFLVCERVVTSNAQMVHKYRQGKKGLMGYFMAEVMKQTQGSADPRVATAILQRMLEEEQV